MSSSEPKGDPALWVEGMGKTGRNEPCPCGAAKKFKHCHGRLESGIDQPSRSAEAARRLAELEAAEHIRRRQQGLGRPILGLQANDHQLVNVGKRVMWSRGWKTFPDFLSDYLKGVITAEWGNAELKKPFSNRHPLLQLYDSYCTYQRASGLGDGQVRSAAVTGVVGSYLGLAYGLYLLEHNVELQARLLARLKDRSNFQGAYYEVLVASILIRQGFTLVLEDEASRNERHCEWAAIAPDGQRFTVEAKMRAVRGILGRTEADGGPEGDPLSRLNKHLSDALDKPSNLPRLVFIDLNCPMDVPQNQRGRPELIASAERRLKRREHFETKEAYVFITNLPFHRYLDTPLQIAVLPYGFNIPDFNPSGRMTLTQRFRSDEKHRVALNIAEGFTQLGEFPATFDGTLPSEINGERKRIKVGGRYDFEGTGVKGTVTSATVLESNKSVWITVAGDDGKNSILQEQMDEDSFADYMNHKDAYFGEVRRQGRYTDDPYEFYCNMMEIYREYNRAQLISQFGDAAARMALDQYSDLELREMICENIAQHVVRKSA